MVPVVATPLRLFPVVLGQSAKETTVDLLTLTGSLGQVVVAVVPVLPVTTPTWAVASVVLVAPVWNGRSVLAPTTQVVAAQEQKTRSRPVRVVSVVAAQVAVATAPYLSQALRTRVVVVADRHEQHSQSLGDPES